MSVSSKTGKRLGNQYEIRVIGEVELDDDGEYSAADYELRRIVQRSIEDVEEIPASSTILCS